MKWLHLSVVGDHLGVLLQSDREQHPSNLADHHAMFARAPVHTPAKPPESPAEADAQVRMREHEWQRS